MRANLITIPAAQAMFLLYECTKRIHSDTVLRADRKALAAADAFVGNQISVFSRRCIAERKSETLDRVLGQVKPFADAAVNTKQVSPARETSVG